MTYTCTQAKLHRQHLKRDTLNSSTRFYHKSFVICTSPLMFFPWPSFSIAIPLLPPPSNSRDQSHSIFPSQETSPQHRCSPGVHGFVQPASLPPESCCVPRYSSIPERPTFFWFSLFICHHHSLGVLGKRAGAGSIIRFLFEAWLKPECTRTRQTWIRMTKGRDGKAGGFTPFREEKGNRSQQNEGTRRERAREKKKNTGRRREKGGEWNNRQSGRVKEEEKSSGVLFLLHWDKRLQHDGGRCQMMCDKSKLKLT